jgi:hypothetical protein
MTLSGGGVESVGPMGLKLKRRVLGRLNSLAEIDTAYRARANSFAAEDARKKTEQA